MKEQSEHLEHALQLGPAFKRVTGLALILAILVIASTLLAGRSFFYSLMLNDEANLKTTQLQLQRSKIQGFEHEKHLLASLGVQGDLVNKALTDYANQQKEFQRRSSYFADRERLFQHSAAELTHAILYGASGIVLSFGLFLTLIYFFIRRDIFPVLGILSFVLSLTAVGLPYVLRLFGR
ncbi:MAG: hypothetical protein PHX83_00375 [Acidobacteriia bacterium]|nr:hypothetical protein [Terriglobia bacterium]